MWQTSRAWLCGLGEGLRVRIEKLIQCRTTTRWASTGGKTIKKSMAVRNDARKQLRNPSGGRMRKGEKEKEKRG